MTRILPLCFLMLLCACTAEPKAKPSESLFQFQAWPQPKNLEKQSGVAKYVTRGKSAYNSCSATVSELKKMTYPDVKEGKQK
jgi:outer membrane biogenesis lipoprotein LolB